MSSESIEYWGADEQRSSFIVVTETSKRGVRCVSVAWERQGRGITVSYDHTDPDASDPREALNALAPDVAFLPLEEDDAKTALKRAVVMSRIASRAVPTWLFEEKALLGELRAASVDDGPVYSCGGCGEGLDSGRALRIARAPGRLPLLRTCASCGDAASVDDDHLTRGWLSVYAREPRRAMVHAALAERARARRPDVQALRGASLLMLANPIQGAHCLREAVACDPRCAEWRLFYAQALVHCGLYASACAELQEVGVARQRYANVASSLATLLKRSLDTSALDNIERERGMLSALVAMNSGDTRGANTLVQALSSTPGDADAVRELWRTVMSRYANASSALDDRITTGFSALHAT